MDYKELLPLLPGMSLALPPGGSGGDLVLLRQLKRQLSAETQDAVRADLVRAERAVSPAILPLLEHALDGTGMRAVYPWKDGLPLAAAVARAREAGAFAPLGVAGRLVSEALGALSTMHALEDAEGNPSPLIHGSFRADSLWLGFDGLLQLADAGLSALTSRTDPTAVRDVRADVYAAGVVAHVVVTGHMPLGTTESGHDPRVVKGNVPEPVALVIMQATHPDPGQRFLDATLMKDAWDGALSIQGGVGVPEQVNRWLSSLFPANHPLIGALKNMLSPLGAGTLLPAVAGPLLSSTRLAPIRDKPSSGSGAAVPPGASARLMAVRTPGTGMPQVSAPRLTPVTSSVEVGPGLSGPASSALPATAEMRAPTPAHMVPATDPHVMAPPPAPSQPAAANVSTLPRMNAVPEPAEAPPVPRPSADPPAAAAVSPNEETTGLTNRTRRRQTHSGSRPRLEDGAHAPDDLAVSEPRKKGPGGAVLVVAGLALGMGGMLVAFKMGQQQTAPTAPLVAALPATPAARDPVRDPEPEPRAAVRPDPPPVEPRPEPRPEPKVEPKPDPKPEPRSAPRKSPQKSGKPSRDAAGANVGSGGDDGSKATLHLDVTPWAKVFVDGKLVGKTPLKPLRLNPGRHTIKFVCEEYRASRVEQVDVQPGMEGTLTVQFTPP